MDVAGPVRDRSRVTTGGWPGRRQGVWAAVSVLVLIVMVFFAIRLVTDVPNIVTGDLPSTTAFEYRYALHPLPAYVHIVPGVVFLLGALFQLRTSVRNRHLAGHRRLGRVLVPAGLVSGALAVVVGVWFPYGGWFERTAAIVFGVWFVTALVLAWRAIRRRDVLAHRRWMVRAFAVALGVGTIRVWIGIFQLVGLLAIQDDEGTAFFGLAFWLGLVAHAVAAEVYLRARPRPVPVARGA